MLGNSPSWLPLPSSPMWLSRNTRFVSEDAVTGESLLVAVMVALRCHVGDTPVAVQLFSGGSSTEGPVLVPNDTTSLMDFPVVPTQLIPSIVLSQTTPEEGAPSLAYSVHAPAIITFTSHTLSQTSLTVHFCRSEIKPSEAGWFLIHVSRALWYICKCGRPCLPDELANNTLERYLFKTDTARHAAYKGTIGIFPPTYHVLRDIISDRTRLDPLATAIILYRLDNEQPGEPPSCADHGQARSASTTVTYAALLASALLAVSDLSLESKTTRPLHPTTDDPVEFAISILAESLCGLYSQMAKLDTRKLCPTSYATGSLSANEQFAGDMILCQDWSPSSQSPALDYSVSPDALAVHIPQVKESGEAGWLPLTHTEAIDLMDNRYDVLRFRHALVYFHDFTRNPLTSLLLWETFMHCGTALFCVSREFEPASTTASLLRALECNYIVVGQSGFSRMVDIVRSAKQGQASSFAAPFNTVFITEDDVSTSNLPADTHVITCTQRCEATRNPTPEPEEPVILYQGGSKSLTPYAVLHMMSAGEQMQNIGAGIIAVGDNLVVKVGRSVRMTELHNALFVREHTSIAVPAIHLAFSRGAINYMVMDRISGRCLQDDWAKFTDEERTSVLSQLRQYLDELRSLPPPCVPGPVGGGRLEGQWFTFYGKDPFESYDDLVSWMNRMLKIAHAEHVVGRFTTDGQPLVFTHQDISPRNLILDDDGKLWMIDWDLAGWYPPYFEYACIAEDIGVPGRRPPVGWRQAALEALPDRQWEAQYASLRAIQYPLTMMPNAK